MSGDRDVQGWLDRAQQILRSGWMDFAGVAVFYGLMWTVGLKAAILGTVVFVVLDGLRRQRMRLGFPRIYVLSSAMVLAFGAIDLMSDSPFMIKYEAPISSVAIGVMFALGARGKSIFEEVLEQKEGLSCSDKPDLRRFFQLLTLTWAFYFALKALVFVWIGESFPIERAITIRTVVGFGSLALMVGVMMQARRLYVIWRRLGLIPPGKGGAEFLGIEAPASGT